jgi:HTH-type transcriptional regulator / antitoxin HigA
MMILHNEYIPSEVSPPGETLADILDEHGMTQADLARRVGHAEKTISEIINGKAPITPEMAVKLEMVLGAPAHFWNMRQTHYEEYMARERQSVALEPHLDWIQKFPYKQMVRYRWISDYSDPLERLRELLRYFGFAAPQEWETYWQELWTKTPVALRTSPAFANQQNALAAWLRYGEVQARTLDCAPYNEELFHNALHQIRRLTVEDPHTYQFEVVRLCAQAGVALVLVPEIDGIRASGAARWLAPDKAMIQLCLRYKTDDQLWFTFFHEAAHILLDGKRQIFIDADDDKEERAGKFAADFLIPPDQWKALVSSRQHKYLTKAEILQFAEKIGIAPGIIVGRLQHAGVVPHHHHNGLKRKLRWITTA